MAKKNTAAAAQQIDRITLLKIVDELIKKGRSNKNSIDESQVAYAFHGYEVADEQMEYIQKFIEEKGVEIVPDVDEQSLKSSRRPEK